MSIKDENEIIAEKVTSSRSTRYFCSGYEFDDLDIVRWRYGCIKRCYYRAEQLASSST